MVVSHRETTISSNIRAIIEQLNLNPVERLRLIDRTRENARISVADSSAKITIGVYGCNERNDRLTSESTSRMKIDVYKDKVEGVDRPDSPTKIGIYECRSSDKGTKLDSVDCPNSPTKIGIYECRSSDKEAKLDSVDCPNSPTKIGIYECRSSDKGAKLDSVDRPDSLPRIGIYECRSSDKGAKLDSADSPKSPTKIGIYECRSSDKGAKLDSADSPNSPTKIGIYECRSSDKGAKLDSSEGPNSPTKIVIHECRSSDKGAILDSAVRPKSPTKIGDMGAKSDGVDCPNSPTKICIYECRSSDKETKLDSVDFASNTTGKVTIGIEAKDYPGKVTIGVYGSGEKAQEKKPEDTAQRRRIEMRPKSKAAEMRQRIPPVEKAPEPVEVTRNSEDVIDRETPTPKEDLPQLECGSLSHTAAHHRISVRPKNRRPPRRAAISSSASGSTITTITESSDAPDSLEHLTSSGGSSPVEAKTPTGLRKSSSRLSRNSDIFEELETKLPARKPASSASLSPDSLDSSNANGRSNQELSSEPEEPREAKPVARKPSNRVSKGSDVYEELEAKLPRRRSSSSRLSKSPDSLESSSFVKSNETSSSFVKSNEMSPSFVKTNEMSSSYAKLNEMNSSFTKLNEMNSSFRKSNEVFDKLVDVDESRHSRKLQSAISKSTEGFEKLMDRDESRHSRKLQSAISKSTEGFEKLDHVEIRPVSRRLHGHQMSKSIEGFDKLVEDEETKLRTPARRFSSVVASKSSEAPLKAADSLEAMETMEASDDSMERRRSSFEFRPRKSPPKLISMSSENFEALDHGEPELRRTELQKRSSISDVNLSRGRRYSKAMSKSTESFEAMDVGNKEEESNGSTAELGKGGCWRSAKRVARLSSESSDNLELDDRLENRRARRAPKRIPSTSVVDIFPTANHGEDERRPTPTRKPPRLQKSSESSELGSTDTLDSERRNRSDSTETLDSLEKDADREPRDDEATDDNAPEKCDKNNSWSAKTTTDMNSAVSDSTEDSNRAPSSPDKSYWRQTSDSKENIDIRQLLAITIVTRMADNGNNQRNNSVAYPKKQQQQQQQLQQQQQQLSSPPSSPVVQQEDNKMLFNNLLASKNDEDLQNMLNGNISEVSTDTKSFKEKLIMFEKLGK